MGVPQNGASKYKALCFHNIIASHQPHSIQHYEVWPPDNLHNNTLYAGNQIKTKLSKPDQYKQIYGGSHFKGRPPFPAQCAEETINPITLQFKHSSYSEQSMTGQNRVIFFWPVFTSLGEKQKILILKYELVQLIKFADQFNDSVPME